MQREGHRREKAAVHDGGAQADLWLRIAVSIGLVLWGLLLALQSANAAGGTVAQSTTVKAGAANQSAVGSRAASQLVGRSLLTLDGKNAPVVLGETATVVHFWATWCAPCKRELPLLDDIATKYGNAGVRFCAVSVDKDLPAVRRFVDRLGLGLPIFVDGPDGLARALDLPALPYTIVIDRQGRTVHEAAGGDDAQIAAVEAAIHRSRTKGAEAASLAPVGGEQ